MHELVDRYRLVGPDQQHREQAALFGRGQPPAVESEPAKGGVPRHPVGWHGTSPQGRKVQCTCSDSASQPLNRELLHPQVRGEDLGIGAARQVAL